MQLDVGVGDGNHFGPEFHPDGHFMLLAKSSIDELQEEAGFPDTFILVGVPVSPMMMNLNMYANDMVNAKIYIITIPFYAISNIILSSLYYIYY